MLPLVIATLVNDPAWWKWSENSLADVSKSVGGEFLQSWVFFSGVCSYAGMFTTELFVDSFQLFGMANHGLAPRLFAARSSKFDTPHTAICASVVIMLFLVSFEFEDILLATNAITAMANALILVTMYKLRKKYPDLHRPFKVPVPDAFLPLFSLGTMSVTAYMVGSSLGTFISALVIVIVLVTGVLLYCIQMRWGLAMDFTSKTTTTTHIIEL